MGEPERVIPEEWSSLILRQMGIGRYADSLRAFGIELPPPKPLTKWQRRKLRLSYRIERIRTRIALKIAPWLDSEPW